MHVIHLRGNGRKLPCDVRFFSGCLFLWQDAQSLHGDIPQKQREITLKGFRNGDFGILVATNVAARGLDIPEVDLVVQCSPPKVSVFIISLFFRIATGNHILYFSYN